MKIPSSSSILLAGLAISSSSSCLAAPTGDGNHDVDISSSSSTSYASSSVAPAAYPTGVNAEERSDTIRQRAPQFNKLAARDDAATVMGMLDGLPIVGPLLKTVMSNLSQTSKALDVESNDSGQLDAQSMQALRNAVDEVTRIIQSATGQGGPGNATLPNAPVSAQSDGDGSGIGAAANQSASGSGAAPTPTQATAADDGPDTTANVSTSSTSASATPSSPPMPGNPPNTPTPDLPVNP
ncbi:hypothetical protein JR316_0000487 [Psilocybe cubensis]|uniref:Uncharacterized protein n=2 Tax=Psilocybe cubensis TaxID=181762 RepID=A0A8H7Y6W7_PSICU|nr:hypothetical protein JR316_0000487 [Psilocybe cubensis]KAH9486423.1 hypothetical protein JR316_0000487 [Psilocybe cubensis]